jgi:hypothetical protein
MRTIIFIFILLNATNLFGQRTTFENKLVVYVFLDSVEIDLVGLDVFTSDSTFQLGRIEKNLFHPPSNLSKLKIDSFQLLLENHNIFLQGNLIKVYQENGVVKLFFNRTLDFGCVESWKSSGCTGEAIGYDTHCNTKLKIYSYVGDCLLKFRKKIIEDCTLKNERNLDDILIQGGLPAQYEK